MSSFRPSRYARQSMRTNAGAPLPTSSSLSSSSMAQRSNPTSRSVVSKVSRGTSNGSRQVSNAKNSRIQRLNRVKSARGQHSRAITVASIQGLMKQVEGPAQSQDHVPSLTIQVKPNETVVMSQLSEECSSHGESIAMSSNVNKKNQHFSTIGRGYPGRKCKSSSNMSIVSKDRRGHASSHRQVRTKLVETPTGARSSHQYRKPVSGPSNSKTPRHRNGGQEFGPRFSQQSFATASFQDSVKPEDAAADCLAQESLTLNESNAASLCGNSSFVNGSFAVDLAKTMKSEMESCMQWFTREQKKLQRQQNELATYIREGEEAITSCLSKSMKEASDHGEAVVASVKKNSNAVEEIAKKAVIDLTDQKEKAEMSSKESYAKLESLANETKKQAAEVKAEGKLAHSLYEKATTVLETVQKSADYIQSFFQKSSKAHAQHSSGMVIESDARKVNLSTPLQSSRGHTKRKSSKPDTVVIIENTLELESVSPLTVKSLGFGYSKQPKRCAVDKNKSTTKERNPLEDVLNKTSTNRSQRVTPSPDVLEKQRPSVPTTPTNSNAASNSIAPKRRRLACCKDAMVGDENRCLKSSQDIGTKTARKNTISKPAKKANAHKTTIVKPTRKNRRKKRSTVVREIDFSLP